MVNAALSGIAIAACGMFFPGTPTWVIWAVVLLGGFFPALQFTSLNSLDVCGNRNAATSAARRVSGVSSSRCRWGSA